jgi:hypothetical protein
MTLTFCSRRRRGRFMTASGHADDADRAAYHARFVP